MFSVPVHQDSGLGAARRAFLHNADEVVSLVSTLYRGAKHFKPVARALSQGRARPGRVELNGTVTQLMHRLGGT